MSTLAALPTSITANPLLSQWVAINADETISVFSGKVELGQGIVTAIAQIAADELGVSPAQLTIVAGHTDRSPDEWYTAGSQSIEVGGTAMRIACAQARGLFAASAARQLGVPHDALTLAEGVFAAPGKAGVSYWQLAATVDLKVAVSQEAQAAPRGASLMGRNLPRRDIGAKLSGAAFVNDIELPGMLHARMLRGPTYGSQIEDAALERLRSLPGIVQVVRSGNFLCLLGEREHDVVKAVAAAQKLVRWRAGPKRAARREISDLLRSLPALSETVHQKGQAAAGVTAVRASYSKPYIAHASIGVAAAAARFDNGHLTIWSHTQGPHFLRNQTAQVLGMAQGDVTVIHRDGAGCYGHNSADDVAFDAALAAKLSGRPVLLQWSREEELSWSPFGSAGLMEIDAALDASGAVSKWHAGIWSHTHIKRPGWGAGVNLLGAWAMDPPVPEPAPADMPLPAGGGHRNGIALYAFAHQQLDYHFIAESPVRVSALRGLGAYNNVFAIESCMDELALASGQDPVAFRLRHLADARAKTVIEAAAKAAGWQPGAPGGEGRGRGIGFSQYKNRSAYCAVVVEVELAEKVRVLRVVAAVDAGHIVNPDGLINQVEGGVVQAISWTLKEAVAWDEDGVKSRSWEEYPILGFDEVPEVEVVLLDQPGQPGLGAGECAAGPVAAAIANAVQHAIGIRVRDLPMTPERIARVINEAN
jgi:CO/xanthine dehydrogenase Mo-binding subunit